ncbi:hypothetical protein M9458_021757, partial [Cirrhinus mrigala]
VMKVSDGIGQCVRSQVNGHQTRTSFYITAWINAVGSIGLRRGSQTTLALTTQLGLLCHLMAP